MPQVRLTINGRSYRLECDEASEARFNQIADYVGSTVEGLIEEFGQIGHDQIMLLATLRLADELLDAKDASGSDFREDEPATPVANKPKSSSKSKRKPVDVPAELDG
ncbi:MAG: cell division protein ZapA [Pseudomonadota bacterium]